MKQSHQVGPFDSRKGSVDEMPVFAQKKIAETSIWRETAAIGGGSLARQDERRKGASRREGQKMQFRGERAIWRLTSARLPRACARLTGASLLTMVLTAVAMSPSDLPRNAAGHDQSGIVVNAMVIVIVASTKNLVTPAGPLRAYFRPIRSFDRAGQFCHWDRSPKSAVA